MLPPGGFNFGSVQPMLQLRGSPAAQRSRAVAGCSECGELSWADQQQPFVGQRASAPTVVPLKKDICGLEHESDSKRSTQNAHEAAYCAHQPYTSDG